MKKLVYISAAMALGLLVTNTAQGKDWIDDPNCQRLQPYEAPHFIDSRVFFVVGIGMNEEGEFTRHSVKPNLLKRLPKTMTEAETMKFVKTISAKDFFNAKSQVKSHMKTPLDVESSNYVNSTVAYILLPKAWKFDDVPLSLKSPATDTKHHAIDKNMKVSNDKRAALFHVAGDTPGYDDCSYGFNLHLSIHQAIDGKVYKTPLLIDPEVGADGGLP